jgi:flavodoxin
MDTLLVYDTEYGNTEALASTIAEVLRQAGTVVLATAAARPVLDVHGFDLLVVGGPTQRHGLSPALRAVLDRIAPGALHHISAAVFDTRYHMVRLVSGSAAHVAATKLEHGGAWLLAPPESFFVTRKEGSLERGERERARRWAEDIRREAQERLTAAAVLQRKVARHA